MSDKKISPREAAIAVLKRAQELYKNSTLAKSEDLTKGEWAKIHSKLKREGYSEESADKIDGAIKAKMGKSEEPLEKNVLDANARKHIKAKNFAGPHKSYPIENAAHARDALSRVSANGSPEEKAEVRAKVHAKYPGIGKSDADGHNPDAQADADLGEKVEQDVQEHEAHNEDPAHAEKPMKGHIKLAKFMGRMEHKKGEKAKSMAKGDGQTLGAAIGFPGAPATTPTPTPMPGSTPMGKSK